MTVIHLSTGHAFVRESVVAITALEGPAWSEPPFNSVCSTFNAVGIGFSVQVKVHEIRGPDDYEDQGTTAFLSRARYKAETIRQEFTDRLLWSRQPASAS